MDPADLSPISSSGGVLKGGTANDNSPSILALGYNLNTSGDYTLEWHWKNPANSWFLTDGYGFKQDKYHLFVGNLDSGGKHLSSLYLHPDFGYYNLWSVDITSHTGVWSHMAISVNDGETRVFINGQQQVLGLNSPGIGGYGINYADGSAFAVTGNVYSGVMPLVFSNYLLAGEFNTRKSMAFQHISSIDEIRYTIGVGRYLSNFTPPTGKYPDSGPIIGPDAPKNLNVLTGNNQLGLSWTAPLRNGGSNITDYVLQYSSNSGTTWTTFNDGISTSTSGTITGLTNGSTYIARVAAINSQATGKYVTSSGFIPNPPIVITSQPLNDYATTSSENITFSTTATGGGGSLAYQWQYYGQDYANSDYTNAWRDLSGATSASFATSVDNLVNTYGLYDFDSNGILQLRCSISAPGGTPATTNVVRFLKIYSLHYPSAYWYGSNGSSSNGGSPQTISLQSGENLVLDLYNFNNFVDTSWYSGNDTTVKIQVATTGPTDSADWTDLSSQDSRGGFQINAYNITPSTGTKYYRAIALNKWPYTANNGSGFASKNSQYRYYHAVSEVMQVTWP
jgi:hypothetical protein